MKTNVIFSIGLIVVTLLIACSGSEIYRGNWKATDSAGNKFDLIFDAKTFSVSDSAGKKTSYDYTQNSVKIENSVANYGIRLGDGRAYQVNFPSLQDKSRGLIIDGTGIPLYTISRTDYLKYDDVYKLN